MNVPSEDSRAITAPPRPDRTEVLMVGLVTIAVGHRLRLDGMWQHSDVEGAWLGSVAGLPVAMLPASIGTVILRHRRRAASSDRTPHE